MSIYRRRAEAFEAQAKDKREAPGTRKRAAAQAKEMRRLERQAEKGRRS